MRNCETLSHKSAHSLSLAMRQIRLDHACARLRAPCLQVRSLNLQHNATSWDNGCQKPPLLTPFLTPVAPRRARDRVLSILALGLISRCPKRLPPPFPYTGSLCHQTASYSPKMAPLHFCTSGNEMPLTEEPGLRKVSGTFSWSERPCSRSPSHSVSTTNTLSGALCSRPLPSASRTSSRDCYRPHYPRPSHLLAVFPLLSSPAAVAGRCVTRQPRAVGPVRHFRLTFHKTDPPQDR
jgi:hypothetical protein